MTDPESLPYRPCVGVVLIDTRGHGRSTRADRPYSYELLAGDVLAVLDAIGLASAPLVGAATVSRNDTPTTLDIFETQLGLQYEFRVAETPVTCFFRTACEFQHWGFGNVNLGGAGFGGTIGELTTNSFASGGTGSATLLGLSVATGFTW